MPRPSGWTGRRSRAAAACIALALLLAACPGGNDPSTAPTIGRPAPTPTQRTGGELVVAYPHEPPVLNPFLAGGESPATRDLVRVLMPSLFRIEPDGKRSLSLLAEEPVESVVAGGLTVRMKLRDEAVWSDGTPITAEDVRFTWQAVTDDRWRVASREGYDRLRDVVVEGPKALRLVFDGPFPRWRDLFSAGQGVLPKHKLEGSRFDRSFTASWTVSGGPFVFKAWTRGLEIVFERNPRAWEGVPGLDRLRVQFVPDVVTAHQLFASGRVDVIGPYQAVDAERRARGLRGATVTADEGGTWARLVLDLRDPALNDVRVRQALAYAVDRAAIAETLVREEGSLLDALSGVVDPSRPAPFSRYRPEGGGPPPTSRAEALLDRAGWRAGADGFRRKGGRDLDLTVAAVGADELTARVLRAVVRHAADAGIRLNVVGLDADRLWGEWIRSVRLQTAFLVSRDPPGGAARARYQGDRAVPAGMNLSGVDDGALDRLLNDPSEEATRIQDRLAELVPEIPFYLLRVVVVAGANARGPQANASADGFLWNAAAWSRAASPAPSPTPTSPSPTGARTP